MSVHEFYVDRSGRVDGHYARIDGSIARNPTDAHKEFVDTADISGIYNCYLAEHTINGKKEIHHIRIAVMNDGQEIALMLPTKPGEPTPLAIDALDKLPQVASTPSQQARSAQHLGAAINAHSAMMAKADAKTAMSIRR